MKIDVKLALFKDHKTRIGRFIPADDMGLPRKESEKALLWLLESMVNIARIELKTENIPPLYTAGVVYRREDGTEIWKDPINVYRDGFGDCEDLSIWRTAELRNLGKKAKPYIRYRIDEATGMYIYHVLVLRPNGLEDPSLRLGMR